MDTPLVKTKKGMSPIWILPLLALILGGWLLYKDFRESGFFITVQMKDASGLTPDKTKVFFKGLPIGTLRGITISSDLKWIYAKVEMVKEVKEKLKKDSKIWVVRPEVSFNGITGLDTIVKGSYFEIEPGTAQETTRTFTALDEPPPLSSRNAGLHLTLYSDEAVSLHPGSPVYFKKIEVGEVISNHLQDDASIETQIIIYPKYDKLITDKTLFYVSSGLRVDATLPKLSLQLDPLKTILRGGISFISPKGGKALTDTHSPHTLYKDKMAAENSDNILITLDFPVENELMAGSEIQYNGVPVGTIDTIALDTNLKSVHAKAYIRKDLKHLLKEGTYLYAVRARFNAGGIDNPTAIISGPYVNLIPGDGKPKTHFLVYDRPPENIPVSTGLNIVLETDRLGSLGYNKPVYYRQVQVGKTTGYKLSATGQKVLIYVNIEPKYIGLIRENTKFWNSTGIHIKGGLMTTMKISTESLATLISGGISLSTPEDKDEATPIENGHHFQLSTEPDDKWLNWSPELKLGMPSKQNTM